MQYIIDKLRLISSLRLKVLEKCLMLLQLSWIISLFQHVVIPHIFLLLSSLLLIFAIFIQSKHIDLLTFHILFMSLGCLLFLGEGILSYRNRFLVDTLSPIMQHNSKTKVRAIHQASNVIGTSFLFFGFMFIIAHKIEMNERIISLSIHAFIGFLTILLVIYQIIIGTQKFSNYMRNNQKIYQWHGDVGLITWDCIFLTVLLGAYQYFSYSIFNIFVILSICISWMTVHLQMKRRLPEEDDENDNYDNSVRNNLIYSAFLNDDRQNDIPDEFSNDDIISNAPSMDS